LKDVFPRFAAREGLYGIGALWAVVEADGGRPSLRVVRREQVFAKPARRPREKFVGMTEAELPARLFNALGNAHRLDMLKAIFTGAGTYAALAERLNLKAGPLYHHVKELRLAGLLELSDRDCYRLTEYGKYALILACSAAGFLGQVAQGKLSSRQKPGKKPKAAVKAT
jgi:hypothetical protein